MTSSIYVTFLRYIPAENLQEYFSKFGAIKFISFRRKGLTRGPRKHTLHSCFVNFEDEAAATAALKANGDKISEIEVRVALRRKYTPGKKEEAAEEKKPKAEKKAKPSRKAPEIRENPFVVVITGLPEETDAHDIAKALDGKINRININHFTRSHTSTATIRFRAQEDATKVVEKVNVKIGGVEYKVIRASKHLE